MPTSSSCEEWLPFYNGFENSETRSWEIVNTKNCGRGMQATRNIGVNELIFSETPLLLGPRPIVNGHGEPLICVACYCEIKKNNVCPNNCGLPVCGADCSRFKNHVAECALLKSWQPKKGSSVSLEILQTLTVFRAMLLPDHEKCILALLQANRDPSTEKCIDDITEQFACFTKDANLLEFFKRTVSVLNTNAYKTVISSADDPVTISLRGVYPLQALFNHECVPNTRHSVINSDYRTNVYAIRPIKKGDAITTAYSNLFWNTTSRRAHIQLTKKFMCICSRCSDPTEMHTNLSALKCFTKSCVGYLLPLEPLCSSSPWKCVKCFTITDFQKICNFQQVISSIVREKSNGTSLRELIDSLSDSQVLTKSLCTSNQFIVELKLSVIRKVDILCAGVTLEDIAIKERYCIELLDLIEKLKAGDCSLKGFLCYELYRCRRLTGNSPRRNDEDSYSQNRLLEISWKILKNDITAPIDLIAMHSAELFQHDYNNLSDNDISK